MTWTGDSGSFEVEGSHVGSESGLFSSPGTGPAVAVPLAGSDRRALEHVISGGESFRAETWIDDTNGKLRVSLRARTRLFGNLIDYLPRYRAELIENSLRKE